MAGERAHVYAVAEGHGLRHDPLNAIVAPRPIGWISTIGASGAVNLAPYSFFNLFNYRPPIVAFSSIGWKDTVANASETRAFCWNLATRALGEAMNRSSAPAPRGVDEFDVAGLTRAPSRLVAPPRVLESPVNLECRVTQILELETTAGERTGTWMVFGEVVVVHIDQDLLRDGVYDTAAARPIVRGGGMADYFEIRPDALFKMDRPAWPVD